MTMTPVKLSYNSKLVPDPGLVLQTPLCATELRVEIGYCFTSIGCDIFSEERPKTSKDFLRKYIASTFWFVYIT